MYEKFTDRARKVMMLANQEAQRFNHEYIGTEHILLGLLKEGSGTAAYVLKALGLDLHNIRIEIEKLVQSGPEMVTMGKLPHTPRTKKVIEYAMAEARALKHGYVGTEHILLGLLHEREGVAAQILVNLLTNEKNPEDAMFAQVTNRVRELCVANAAQPSVTEDVNYKKIVEQWIPYLEAQQVMIEQMLAAIKQVK